MIGDKILIGKFYPSNSYLHRLDARAKVMATFLYMIALFIINDWLAYALFSVIFVVFILLAKVPLSMIWQGLKPVLVFVLITVVLNFFLISGDVIWSWGVLHITTQGLSQGFAMGLRLFLLVGFATLLTLTCSPLELTDAIEKLLSPFARIGLPANEIAMMMSIALRFIPILFEETNRIMLAQKARGATFSQGGVLHRARQLLPVIVPLFVAAFRRAEELAEAMEARCYHGGVGRTKWKLAVWKTQDSLYLCGFLALFALSILWRVWG